MPARTFTVASPDLPFSPAEGHFLVPPPASRRYQLDSFRHWVILGPDAHEDYFDNINIMYACFRLICSPGYAFWDIAFIYMLIDILGQMPQGATYHAVSWRAFNGRISPIIALIYHADSSTSLWYWYWYWLVTSLFSRMHKFYFDTYYLILACRRYCSPVASHI